jgi:release factor glutamine methyltransferase
LPNAFGVGLEISPDAAMLARSNLSTLGFAKRSSIVVGDWAAALDGHFDIVISNPPYIASAEIEGLAPEVRHHDPIVALDGGPDGLEAYRAIAAALGRLVKPEGGAFFLEMGVGQADGVMAILAQAGLGGLNLRRDLAGNDRVVQGRLLITGELTLFEDATWREPKKRLVLSSESSSARSPSESRAAVGLAGACTAPAPSNA